MSGIQHIGWRVVARGACDNFELEQAAREAMQLLHEAKVSATWFRVTKVRGREQLQRLHFQPQLFAGDHSNQKGA